MAALAIIIMGAAACGGRGKAPPALQEVGAATVTRGAITRDVLFTGNIVAQDAFDIYPRATGKVSKKILKEGDAVKRGQPILLVERDEVGYSFKPLPVVSLADGVVGSIAVDVGSFVEPARPVATVVRPGNMRVKLDVPERYLDAIAPGATVSLVVDTLGGAEYQGTTVTRSPVVNEKTRTANVEVEVANTDGRLRHGMFGRLKLVVERRDDVLLVPLAAISWEGEKTIVYRIADGKVHRVEVKPGLRNTASVEILEGIAEGDRLATGRLLDLEEGEAVNVQEPKPQP
jgi:membrane fusion protein, multidrug efflux system